MRTFTIIAMLFFALAVSSQALAQAVPPPDTPMPSNYPATTATTTDSGLGFPQAPVPVCTYPERKTSSRNDAIVDVAIIGATVAAERLSPYWGSGVGYVGVEVVRSRRMERIYDREYDAVMYGQCSQAQIALEQENSRRYEVSQRANIEKYDIAQRAEVENNRTALEAYRIASTTGVSGTAVARAGVVQAQVNGIRVVAPMGIGSDPR